MIELRIVEAILSLVVAAIGGSIGSAIAHKLKFIFDKEFREAEINWWRERAAQEEISYIREKVLMMEGILNKMPPIKLIRRLKRIVRDILYSIGNRDDLDRFREEEDKANEYRDN
jgi:hypothetical protein